MPQTREKIKMPLLDSQFTSDLKQLVYDMSLLKFFAIVLLAFIFIYLLLALFGIFYSQIICKKFNWGILLDQRKKFDGQTLWEISHSIVSIIIFALYGVLTLWCDKNGFLKIIWETPTATGFMIDLVLLSLWNEIHFYVIHRALHGPYLYKKVHYIHHKSLVTSPFATYSFHWIEATALSSVMVLAMLFWNFNIYVLIIFPFISLVMNLIGHSNSTVFVKNDMNFILSASRRHAAHHKYVNGNYGYFLPFLDRLFKTSLPVEKGNF